MQTRGGEMAEELHISAYKMGTAAERGALRQDWEDTPMSFTGMLRSLIEVRLGKPASRVMQREILCMMARYPDKVGAFMEAAPIIDMCCGCEGCRYDWDADAGGYPDDRCIRCSRNKPDHFAAEGGE